MNLSFIIKLIGENIKAKITLTHTEVLENNTTFPTNEKLIRPKIDIINRSIKHRILLRSKYVSTYIEKVKLLFYTH